MMNIKETISGLECMLFELDPKAKELHEAIIALKGLDLKSESKSHGASIASTTSSKYEPKANMRSKTLFAIRELNRFVKNREIAEFLNQKEPNVSVKDFMTALSNPLFFLKKEQRIHKIAVGIGNNGVYWGSAKWLNEDGSVKDGHKYIEEPKQEEIEI